MSVLVVGISHRSAPVPVLERLALDADAAAKLAREVNDNEHVSEAAVIATCNRVEIYADVDRFHGSVEAISQLLCDRTGESAESFVPYLYVHYDDGAVSHLFTVVAGLDSMAVGESQILGQARAALRRGQEDATVGSSLNLLFQQALRVGKRAHAESDIDLLAPSLVQEGFDRGVAALGIDGLAERTVLVLGAGAMASLATATASRAGARVVIANRTPEKAEQLAHAYGGTAISWDAIDGAIAAADLVASCTGAVGVVLDRDRIEAARVDATNPVAVVDLALPHDVDPSVADLPGVSLVNLASLAEGSEVTLGETGAAIEQVHQIVADEIASFLAARHAANVTPTLVALRTMATGVVDAELDRLDGRIELDDRERDEVAQALRRVVDKLLHQPTVRVKELAAENGTVTYATALAELFSLDPAAVDAVTRADRGSVKPQDTP